MARLMREKDWSKTLVGPVSSWPLSLKLTVRMILNSKFGMFLWWGPELVQFYNDAYRPSFGSEGEKHPQALGQRGRECWGEIWEIIYPQIEQVLTKGIATWNENHLVPIYRNGILEEVYWTYSYNPVYEETGEVYGVLVVETETTKQLIGERRTKSLRDLALALKNSISVQKVYSICSEVLADNTYDMPFTLLYMLDEDENVLRLVSSSGLDADASIITDAITPPSKNERKAWPVWDVIMSGKPVHAKNIENSFGQLPGGPWPENTRAAYMLPLVLPNQTKPSGVFISGISPRRILDDDYRLFLESTTRQISTSIAGATAYEQEKISQRELALAQKDAETARKRLHDLFMNAPAAIALLSGPDLKFELANTPYRKLVGSDRDIDGKPLFEALPGLESSLVEIVKNAAFKGKRFVSNELPVLLDWDSNDSPYTKYLNMIYEPLYENNKPNGLAFFGFDVTEQVTARHTIEVSEEKYRTLFETMDQGFAIIDMLFDEHGKPCNYRFLEINPAFRKLTGLDNATGKTILELVPDLEPRWLDIYGNVALTGKAARFVESSQVMGRWFNIYAFRPGNGDTRKVAILFTDITDSKKAEEALKESEAKKDEFLGIASHELKTPLTTMKGYLQLLAQTETHPVNKAYIDKTNAQADKLHKLISDLLDVSKIQAGKLQLNLSTFPVYELLEESIESITYNFKSHKIIQTGDIGPWMLIGDKSRLEQVLVNLLTNAIKYSPRADQVIVKAEKKEDHIQVAVTDFGLGIPREKLSKVFERFQRVHTDRQQIQGLGLGLYIAYDIVSRHKGRMWVESEEGSGSTFYFTLPLLT